MVETDTESRRRRLEYICMVTESGRDVKASGQFSSWTQKITQLFRTSKKKTNHIV